MCASIRAERRAPYRSSCCSRCAPPGSGGGSVRLDVSVGEEEPGVAPIAAFAARVDAARLPNVTHRFTVYRGENHNSVRLASFPSGLYWVYRPAGSP